jgi:aspartyl aminopeptidase
VIQDFKQFIERSPTSWHAVQEMGNRLALKDFTPLSESDTWQLEPNKEYFVIRGGSLCAFRIPEKTPFAARIVAAHTDSPALKLKPHPNINKGNAGLFGVEVYGSPLLSSWLNRDLGVAGRVFLTNSQGKIEEKLIFADDTPLFIPQLAIHLDREVNEKGLLLNKQDHLNALACIGDDAAACTLDSILHRYVSFTDILSFDLFLVPLEKPRILGTRGELFAGYRIDNLTSCYAAIAAIASSKPSKETLQMAFLWDHEEIGSRSREGAASTFFQDILTRIRIALKMNEERMLQLKARSLCLSADMAHALNPNYEQKTDPQHKVLLGKGVSIKFNADLRYATDGQSAAEAISLCRKNNIPYQLYVNRSDIASGSTIGPIFAHNAGIAVADVGCPQLSMHAAREIMAMSDFFSLSNLLTLSLEG